MFVTHLSHFCAAAVNGETELLSAKCMCEQELRQWLEVARGSSGEPVARLRKMHHTDRPSIQGVWTPWTNVPPQTSLETFPSVSQGGKGGRGWEEMVRCGEDRGDTVGSDHFDESLILQWEGLMKVSFAMGKTLTGTYRWEVISSD